MIQFLPCEYHKEFLLPIEQLMLLTDVGIEDAELAMRKMHLDKDHLASLVVSNPHEWPPVLVTFTDRGYILIDGRHRREATIDKGLEAIRALCKQFASEQEVIEAAFEANLHHGLRLTLENRSDYVYILHKHHPDWTQKELAAKAHVRQSTVSEALTRRAQREWEQHEREQARQQTVTCEAREDMARPDSEQELLEDVFEEHKMPQRYRPKPMQMQPLPATEEDHARKDMQQHLKTTTREAVKIVTFIRPLDQTEQHRLLVEWLASTSTQERESLLQFAHIIEDVLGHQPRGRRR